MPPIFRRLVAAQFLSALADNALLLVAIALIQRSDQPGWWVPLLKFFFIASYVLLAPIIGAWADAVPKARLMAWMNAVKLGGALALCAGLHPLAAFALIGMGAAAYAPAKYGLVTELVGSHRLVAANAWVEVSVVGAVLLGTAAGGYLVSDLFADSALATTLASWASAVGFGEAALAPALWVVLLIYAAASAVNPVDTRVVRLLPASVRPRELLQQFLADSRTLWRDRDGGRLSLAVTSVFWGAAAVLQFAVLKWATDRIGLSLASAAYLQAAVALGLIGGASIAGRRVGLRQAPRMLVAGVVLGVLVAVGPWLHDVPVAVALMVAVGIAGGLLMVPMNALLQHRGCQLLSAGRSIAVQGFNENASVLVQLALYALLIALQVPIAPLMTGFGLAIAGSMVLLGWRFRRSKRRAAAAATALHAARVQMLNGRSNSGL
jgi:MFS family permease